MSITFVRTVREYYRVHGRHHLLWRQTHDPYKIWVSEVMLQQTQVERVVPKYDAFLRRFPTVEALAHSRLVDVLTLWVGLGYNRRAHYMHKAANMIVSQYGGIFPETATELEMLPGIGPYTARAITTFAYERHEVFIETNIRSVFIHHFFRDRRDVDDTEILQLIEHTVPLVRVREWYWALMDYGAHLKQTLPNPSRQSKHHSTQSPFKGSVREVRGTIVRILTAEPKTKAELKKVVAKSGVNMEHFETAYTSLKKEGLL